MRGRPVKSQIRQKIVNILNYLETGYGYQIHKLYNSIYGSVTRESIYYHLKKGVATGEFTIEKIKQEKGQYSWGETVEKIYYTLGPNAKPIPDERIKDKITATKK